MYVLPVSPVHEIYERSVGVISLAAPVCCGRVHVVGGACVVASTLGTRGFFGVFCSPVAMVAS